MITPQLTEQYGHVERVSVVRAILSSFACARTGRASNPRRSAAALPVPTLKNSRLDKPIGWPPARRNTSDLVRYFSCPVRMKGNFRKEFSRHARTRNAKCPLNFYKERFPREIQLTIPM